MFDQNQAQGGQPGAGGPAQSPLMHTMLQRTMNTGQAPPMPSVGSVSNAAGGDLQSVLQQRAMPGMNNKSSMSVKSPFGDSTTVSQSSEPSQPPQSELPTVPMWVRAMLGTF